jgi:hypothetical protein
MRVNGFHGHPDVHLWRWPLRWLPVAVCRRCAALVTDPPQARQLARPQPARRASLIRRPPAQLTLLGREAIDDDEIGAEDQHGGAVVILQAETWEAVSGDRVARAAPRPRSTGYSVRTCGLPSAGWPGREPGPAHTAGVTATSGSPAAGRTGVHWARLGSA